MTGEATTGTPAGEAIYRFVEEDGQSRNDGVPPEDNHTVWPDTVPVLNFRHYAADAIPSGGQFDPGGQPSGEPWFGSNRLRYAYRLLDVRLVKDDDGTPVADPDGVPLRSTWTHSPSRAADDTSGEKRGRAVRRRGHAPAVAETVSPRPGPRARPTAVRANPGTRPRSSAGSASRSRLRGALCLTARARVDWHRASRGCAGSACRPGLTPAASRACRAPSSRWATPR